jgi:hypothetical protein
MKLSSQATMAIGGLAVVAAVVGATQATRGGSHSVRPDSRPSASAQPGHSTDATRVDTLDEDGRVVSLSLTVVDQNGREVGQPVTVTVDKGHLVRR